MREFVISSFVQALYTRSYRKKKSKEPLALGNAESPPSFFSFYPPCAPETQDSDKIKGAKSLQSSQDFQFDTSHSIFLGNIFSLLGVFRLKDRKVVPQEPRCKGQCHSSRKEISSPELLETTRLQFWSFTTLSIFREVPKKKEEQSPKKLVMSFQSYSLESFAARFRRNPSRHPQKGIRRFFLP